MNDSSPSKPSNRKRLLFIGLGLIALVFSAQWVYKRSYTVYLDDAHIASNIVSIGSRVPGWIVELPISSGQRVDQQTILAKMDARQTELSLRTIELKIA
ncbi:MAG: biotin/lipoyl-binding protein, partial [Cellvibrionaceae bacterium]|nr:biotin/lipoyl-binding protein [Cellvibrionaceae bacterium]